MYTNQEVESAVYYMQGQVTAAQNRAKELQDKIDRLEIASYKVASSYEDISSFVNWVDHYDVGRSWLGQHREKFEGTKSSAKNSGDSLKESIDRRYDRINTKKRQLESELLECQLSISSMNWSISTMRSYI